MTLRFLPILFLLYSGNIFANYDFPIEIIEYVDNTKIVAFINKKDINTTLSWAPFSNSPPLSISKALKNVKQSLSDKIKKNTVNLVEIELKQMPHHKKHWHYLVKLAYEVNNKHEFHYFVVLMNGKVISALKNPESIK